MTYTITSSSPTRPLTTTFRYHKVKLIGVGITDICACAAFSSLWSVMYHLLFTSLDHRLPCYAFRATTRPGANVNVFCIVMFGISMMSRLL